MSLVKIKIGKFKPEGLGFNVIEYNGKLVVTQVFTDSVAFNNGLCVGDIIYSVNNQVVIESALEFSRTISQIRGKIQLLVHRKAKYSRSQHSINNLSLSGSDQISSGSSNKLKSSKSSIDIVHVTDGNYVPEDYIDNYMDPSDTFDDNVDPIQITRKQAYKKTSSEIVCKDSPRFSVKRATMPTSTTYSKDPTITIKRKINTKKMCDSTTANQSGTTTRSRNATAYNQTEPIQSNLGHHVISLSSLINEDSDTIDLCDGTAASDLPSVMSTIQMTDSNTVSSSDHNLLDNSVHLEITVRIISFKDKIKKPVSKKFVLEKDALGLLFQCMEMDDEQVNCNSTAIDPYFSGLSFYMSSWHSNNTISRFFLPIGQSPFDSEIDMESSAETVHIVHKGLHVDFVIDLLKMRDADVVLLHSVLGLPQEMPDCKPAQMKSRRHYSTTDNPRIDGRRQKTQRFVTEAPHNSMISCLPRTKLIENVPLVVIICVSIIERLGTKDIGIYRKSGNEGSRKKLQNIVNNESPDKWANSDEWINVNTVCSLMKSVLRGFGLIDRDTAIKLSMINVSNVDECSQEQVYMDMVYHLRQHLCNPDNRIDQSIKDRSLQELHCRLDTFKYVIKHLDRISRYQQFNKMSPDNLATCFWPTIIEDIPCSDEVDYQISNKSDADKNLKQIVTFWITNADLLCELLDDDDDVQRYKKLVYFCQSNEGGRTRTEVLPDVEVVSEDDVINIVREQIEYYTAESFVPVPECSSHDRIGPSGWQGVLSATRMKPLKKSGAAAADKKLRRASTSLSPRNMRRIDAAVKGLSPLSTKKIDNVTLKCNQTASKKDPGIPPLKPVSLNAYRLSATIKNVPFIVEACVTIINKYGLDLDGIYRISGKRQELTALEEVVHTDRHVVWFHEPYISLWSNIYIVSGLLKSVLKHFNLISKDTWMQLLAQFPERIEQDNIRNVLIAAAIHLRYDKKASTIASKDSKKDNRIRCATLRYVLRHLKAVARHVTNNSMTSMSLAVCFMPVLMEEDESDYAIAVYGKKIQILERLIDHCDWIFQWDNVPSEDISGDEMPSSVDQYLQGYSATEHANQVPRSNDNILFQQAIECDRIRGTLQRLVSKFTASNIDRDSASRTRRHSDSADQSATPSHFLQSCQRD